MRRAILFGGPQRVSVLQIAKYRYISGTRGGHQIISFYLVPTGFHNLPYKFSMILHNYIHVFVNKAFCILWTTGTLWSNIAGDNDPSYAIADIKRVANNPVFYTRILPNEPSTARAHWIFTNDMAFRLSCNQKIIQINFFSLFKQIKKVIRFFVTCI